MKLEDFNKLTDEEKAAILSAAEDDQKKVSDLEAERNSLKDENDKLLEDEKNKTEELAKTKEMNFTLARKLDTGKLEDPEERLFKFIKGD